jgi:hypothetical protein
MRLPLFLAKLLRGAVVGSGAEIPAFAGMTVGGLGPAGGLDRLDQRLGLSSGSG